VRLRALTKLGIDAPRRTLAAVAAIGIAAGIVSLGTPGHLADSGSEFISQGTESYRTTQQVKVAVGSDAFPDLAVILPLEQRLKVLPAVNRVASLMPQIFYSRNEQKAAVIGHFDPGVSPGPAAASLAKRFRSLPGVVVGGQALARQEFVDQVRHDLIRAEAIAFPLLLLLALVVFRGAIAALLPIVTGGLALCISLLVLRVLAAIRPVSILSLDLIVGVVVGLSLDYSLLLISRYREELSVSGDSRAAALVTLSSAGRTVAISSATVAAAFASLLVFPLDFLRSIAIAGMSAAAVAGVVPLVALPTLLSLLGPRVNALAPARWQRSARRAARPAERGLWYRTARLVMRRPVAIAIFASCALLAMGAPSLGMRLTGFEPTSVLAPDTSSRRFEERIKTEFNIPLLDEVTAVVHGSRSAVEAVAARVQKLPDIAVDQTAGIRSGLWLLNIKTSSTPFSGASERLVRELRAGPYRLAVTGITADYLDTSSSLWAHLPAALAMLATTTLVLLFIATGSVILPVKAILMNVLSLAAAFGLLVLIFQDGRLEGLFAYRSLGALSLTQPIVLATCTFGILTDYGVFMLTRIREGWDSGLSNRDAVAIGLERTGRIVTAAAMLFCVAVGASITARSTFVKEAGFGVAAAVAIDATIVRALLVPSLMILLGLWNWWRPKVALWRVSRSTPRASDS
jgi:uncharacterized membrane protein YdfJ with MMPL/SSD domain